MSDQLNTITQLNALFQSVAIAALGMDAELWAEYVAARDAWVAYQAALAALGEGETYSGDVPVEWTDPVPVNPYLTVRIAYMQDGAPGWQVSDNIVSIYAMEIDDDYNAIREQGRSDNEEEALLLDEEVKYTRVWAVRFVCYGPLSAENVRKIKSAMYRQDARRTLAARHVYLVPGREAPRRIPEPFEGRWYDRYDLTMRFNEGVIEAGTLPAIGSAGITVYTDNGMTREIAIAAD